MFTLPGKLWREYSVQGNRHFYYQRHKAELSSVKAACSVPAEKESEKSRTLQQLSPWLLLVKPITQPFLSLPALRAFSLHSGLPCRCKKKKICVLFFKLIYCFSIEFLLTWDALESWGVISFKPASILNNTKQYLKLGGWEVIWLKDH